MNMEELHMAATAYYNNSSGQLQQLASDFFRSMDMNRDGRVCFNEFVAFLRQSGYNWIDPNLFSSLDRNRDGSLDFPEFLTLYYIMTTRRVCCDGCRVCLMGLYFTCVACFDTAGNTYDLCAACYGARRFHHIHADFLDNYVLLRSKSGLPPGEANPNMALVPRPTPANAPQRSNGWSEFQRLNQGLITAVSFSNNLNNYCNLM